MSTRKRTVQRAGFIVSLALLAPFLFAIEVPQASASECASCRGDCSCPAPVPRLETPFGQSLFWQDPCGGGYRDDFMPCYEHNSGPPTWFSSAEFLPLFRDQNGSTPFQAVALRQVATVGDEQVVTFVREAVLSTSDFDTDFVPGVRALFGRAVGDWYRVEFSYMGSYSWSDSAARYADAIPLTINPGTPATFDPGIPPTFDPGIPPTFNPGIPPSYDPGVPPSLIFDLPPIFNPGVPPTFDPGIPPTFEPGVPATFDPGVPPTFTPGVPATLEPGEGMLSPFSNFGNPGGSADLGPVPEANFQPSEGLDNNQYARISFTSRLDSAEANLRRRLCVSSGRYYQGEASCLIGLRYMKVQEEFGYSTESLIADGIVQNDVFVRTDNDLIGPQLGAMAQFLVHDRAWVDAEIKGSLLFSDARSTTDANLFVNGEQTPATTRGSENFTAFLGDLSVNLNYQFTPSLTVRAGYNAFWLDGVALASENFSSSLQALTSANRPAQVNHEGRVVYHGPSLGLVYAR